jgi:ribulose kinase
MRGNTYLVKKKRAKENSLVTSSISTKVKISGVLGALSTLHATKVIEIIIQAVCSILYQANVTDTKVSSVGIKAKPSVLYFQCLQQIKVPIIYSQFEVLDLSFCGKFLFS